jgi:hypothetical protein
MRRRGRGGGVHVRGDGWGARPGHREDGPDDSPEARQLLSAQHPEWSPLPLNPLPDLPVYALDDDQFLYDDREVDYGQPLAKAPALIEMGSANYDCDLWLEISPAPPASVLVTVHNTVPGKRYELLSKQDLNATAWMPEQTVFGTTGQNWTQATVPMMGRPALFLIAVQGGYVTAKAFEGIGAQEALRSPPDSMGAVAPNHFVELVNGRIVIFDKATGVRIPGEAQDTSEFFGGQFMADPRILYDHESQAWVACALELDSKSLMLAVKASSDPVPLDGWTKHTISVVFGTSSPDFDTLGVDANGIYMATVQRGSSPGGLVVDAQTILVIKKPDIYGGVLKLTTFTIDTNPTDLKVWTIQPAVNFDDPPAGGYAWLVAKGPPAHGPPYRGGALYYRRLHWSGDTAELVDTSWQLVPEPVPTYRDYFDLEDGLVKAPQLGDPPGGPVINLRFHNS